jgi:HAE1 family hydrophobic/amphiphilic exporter-1
VVERFLLENRERFEIRSVYSAFREQGGQTDILLVDDGTERLKASEIMELIRRELPRIAIGEVGFGINQRAGGQALQVNVFGDSNETLRGLGETIVPVLRRVEGMRDVRIEEASADRELAVHVDRERAAAYGFSAQEVASYVAIALRGVPLREFRGERGELPVWLRFAGGEAASVDNLREFKLTRRDGTQVPLLSLVEVRVERAAGTIRRQDRQTALPITVDAVPGTDMDRFRQYTVAIIPIVQRFGGRYVVMRGAREDLEGDWGATRIVISEWPSMDAARAFWNSPEYRQAVKLREGTGTFRVTLLETAPPPEPQTKAP